MKWYEAEHYCKKEGGKLVEIDSAEENDALVEEINRKGYTEEKMDFWIGLTDLGSEGDWRLASNGLKPSFLNWAEGEPSNRSRERDEDCARLRIESSRTNIWADLWCEVKTWNGISFHALCEFDPPKESSSTEDPTIEETTTEGTPTTG